MEMNGSQGVAAEVHGMGLPYAPENWPQHGDVWGWRTGRRVVPKGKHFQDRYLYLPDRLYRLLKEEKGSKRKQHIFPSKAAVKKYINEYFPGTDLESFFESFSWRIPALLTYGNPVPIDAQPLRQIMPEACGSNGDFMLCANNEGCSSLPFKEADSADNGNGVMGVTINYGHSEDKTGLESSDFLPPLSQLEAEVDQVLEEFTKSQELERKVVEETLQAQKTFLQQLYQQLDYEENVMVGQSSAAASRAVRERKKQIEREQNKFEKMKKVAKGLAKTPHYIKKNHFGFRVVD